MNGREQGEDGGDELEERQSRAEMEERERDHGDVICCTAVRRGRSVEWFKLHPGVDVWGIAIIWESSIGECDDGQIPAEFFRTK